MKLTAWADMPRSFRKAWMIMRLTSFFILILALHLSAKTTAQKITLSSNDLSLEQFFSQLQKQTGYSFILETGNVNQSVSVHVSDASLESVLDMVLGPLNLTYKIRGKMVNIIHTTDQSQSDSRYALPPLIDIHGRVTDSLGNPLGGASVTVKGEKKGTSTDENGNFILTGVKENTTLLISFTGYVGKTYVVGRDNSFIIYLNKSNNPLDEVQVIAYGTTTQRLNTANINTVSATDIEKQPVSNPLLALEGRAPGLQITQATGVSGSAVTVRIQGQNSIGNGNEPLYLVDGVPYTSQLISTAPDNLGGILGSASGTFSNGNPLSYINPADIESIDILKDADATAIYGSRAANGAILITTKKGKEGQTRIGVNLQQGYGNVTRNLNLLNTPQYLEMRHEAINNDNKTVSNTDYDVNGFWDTTRYTNWQKTLIGGTAEYSNINLNISGGNQNTQYYISGTYHRETTVFPGDFSDIKGSLHFTINNVSPNKKFRIQLSGSYLVDNNFLPASDLTPTAITLAPDAPPIYNPDGSLNWMPTPSGSSTWQNPLASNYNTYQVKANNLIGNGILSYQLFPGFLIKGSFGYTNLQTNEDNLYPLLSTKPENRPYSSRSAVYSNNNISSWIIEPQATYTRMIGGGKLDALIGTTIQQNTNSGSVLYGYGYNSDFVLSDPKSAASITVDGSTATLYKYNALFGRINYNFQEKYLLSLTARRDGSSRFGPQNQFHNFGAIGVGWVFTNESFFKNKHSFFSFGKFKGSYGTTGNDQIGDYQFLNLYSPVTAAVSYQGTTGLLSNGIYNPYLQWEETKKLQFGLDIGLLNERILLTTYYYVNKSSNQLLPYALPITTGSESILANFPATVENKGWEISLNTKNVKNKNFTWSSYFNLTIPKNMLLAFPNLATSSYATILVIGEPLTPAFVKTYPFAGVNSQTGVYQFTNNLGKPTSSPNYQTDRTAFVNKSPRFYGGFENSFQYKGFQLDFIFQFVKQIGVNYLFGNTRPAGSPFVNQPTSVLKRWQQPGDVTSIQRFNSNYSLISQNINAAIYSDAAYSDASYIRLKNLSLSWSLPDLWMKKAHIQNCRLFLQGQNLITITNYIGLDPENQSTGYLPPLKVVTFGVNVGL